MSFVMCSTSSLPAHTRLIFALLRAECLCDSFVRLPSNSVTTRAERWSGSVSTAEIFAAHNIQFVRAES
jgi:hypothetical protein